PFGTEAAGPIGAEASDSVGADENGAAPGAAPDARDTGPDGKEAQAAGDADAEYANVHRGLVHAAIDELATSFATDGVDTLCARWAIRERLRRIDEDDYLNTPLIAPAASSCATELVASGSDPAEAAEDLVIGPMTAEAFAHSLCGHTDEWMSIEEAFAILAEV